jgi:hypothetical protein
MEPHPPVKLPTTLSRELAETPDSLADPTPASVLEGALAIAGEWAGERCIAVVLAGSHATGEGVWCVHEGRPVTLSDLDLYVVLPDEAACRAAGIRARRGHEGLAARLLALGVAAPLETCFRTRASLGRLPAKPGTLELARRGRVVSGDASVLAALPNWTADDVSREERLLLLENRGFELLLSRAARGGGALGALRARHALLKAVADLASVLALAHGELPDGTAARIEWAKRHALPELGARLPLEHQRGAELLPRLWDVALAWRRGVVGALPEPEAAAEWKAAVQAWCSVWWMLQGDGPREPWARALRVAARAPIRRRARQALLAASRGGATAPLGARVRSALAGTPQHRVNGSAAVLLLAAALSSGPPALPVGALRALRALDVTPAADWNEASRDVVRAWDVWVLDGQRTAGDA